MDRYKTQEVKMLKFKHLVWFAVSLAIVVIGMVFAPSKDIFSVMLVAIIPVVVLGMVRFLEEVADYINTHP